MNGVHTSSRRHATTVRAKPKAALSLVPNSANAATVKSLEALLEAARSGQVVGIAFAAALPGHRYVADAAGVYVDDPLAGRGAVAMLDESLRDLARARKD